MTEIKQGQVGAEGSYDLKIEHGKLIATFDYAGSQLTSHHNVKLDIGAILDKIKEKIPGKVDDVIFDVLKSALAAQKPVSEPV